MKTRNTQALLLTLTLVLLLQACATPSRYSSSDHYGPYTPSVEKCGYAADDDDDKRACGNVSIDAAGALVLSRLD